MRLIKLLSLALLAVAALLGGALVAAVIAAATVVAFLVRRLLIKPDSGPPAESLRRPQPSAASAGDVIDVTATEVPLSSESAQPH